MRHYKKGILYNSYMDYSLLLIIGIAFSLLINLGPLINAILESAAKSKHAKQKKETDIFLRKNHPVEKEISDYSYWKKNVEPKYRDSNFYPPDWVTRKKYIAEIYNYKCGICFKEDKMGHSHHITPLADGGNNNINNIAYLCRVCHENQHWHLKKRQEKRYEDIKTRGITEKEYFKEKKDNYEFMQSILSPEQKKKDRDFNRLRGMAIRAERQGKKIDWVDGQKIIDK